MEKAQAHITKLEDEKMNLHEKHELAARSKMSDAGSFE
jgi:hypothetical protein